ncbi:hypothetical protein [Pseudonocardia sp. TRM90224]|uniref:hypothetical protein n=1 Tax=Pseudonocardia sp. TRM90224 TaxID=2812678 RepID=UPI001E54BF35|nr:hypothetical protein [Pseudonocardia sp. TRM90224]
MAHSRNTYSYEFMSDVICTLLDHFENHDKGRLHTCSFIRDDEADWVDCSFSVEHRPEVVYTFRRPISAATGVEPMIGTQLAVSIFLTSIMERLNDRGCYDTAGTISLDDPLPPQSHQPG